jgi:D-lactate dehydrogenase
MARKRTRRIDDVSGGTVPIDRLRDIVGRRHVLTGNRATARYRRGYRTGGGAAQAVVRPGTLAELWRVAECCVAADVSIIMQAANTGLTGGSTPQGADYPGGVVIVSTTRLDLIHLIRDGRQVVCLPGATLHHLERALRPLGREPHSVIGSSCLGASVIGGVCNNSGGSLVRRGPAFTQLALYGAIGDDGALRLVNHLGIALGNEPDEILRRVEAGDFGAADIDPATDRRAHDQDYVARVRAVDEPGAARFNADPRCLFEAAGCAGKLIVLAVRLDTFEQEADSATFYLGTNDPDRLTALRRAFLRDFALPPIAGEYMHRTCFDIADRYGKDMFAAIRALGTDRLPTLFALKARIDALAERLPWAPANMSDRVMQRLGRLLPDHLPGRLRQYRDRFDHHLILKVSADQAAATAALLADRFAADDAAHFRCDDDEAERAFLHRFVAAGAAVRYRAIHRDTVADIVAIDVALPRDNRSWVERLPPALAEDAHHILYYGHFFCQVFHQDYIVRSNVDPIAFEHAVWRTLDARDARYPAEHNVGHVYTAPAELAGFYRSLDPRNQLNPGIGRTTRQRRWADRVPVADRATTDHQGA